MASEKCGTCGSITGYRDPEETDDYWIGIWDFIRHILWQDKGKDWVFESQYFVDCLEKIPDMMVDDLRFEFNRDDLALKAEESLKKLLEAE